MPCLPCVLQCDVDAVCVVSAGAVFNTIIEMFPNMRVSVYIVCIVYIEPTVHLTQQSINMSMQVSPVTTTSIASSYSQGNKWRHIPALSYSKLLRTGRADCNLPCCTFYSQYEMCVSIFAPSKTMNCDKLTQSVSDKIESNVTGAGVQQQPTLG